MSILSKHNLKSQSFNEFKRQASFFFNEKIKTARLALQDVTPAQLMTEEATKGGSWPPDVSTYGAIAKAAFDMDDFCRIMNILDKRLSRFDRNNWLLFYKTMLLLEHLLIHGPLSVAAEMKTHKDVFEEITSFHYIDHKGFNWGLRVEKLSDRIVRLLGDEAYHKEERERNCKRPFGVKGCGSFHQRSNLIGQKKGFEGIEGFRRASSSSDSLSWNQEDEYSFEDELNHPFCDNNNWTSASLLSHQE